ncbi:hypothetical protein ACHAQE_007554 [Botrytis cinerea]
MLGRPTGRRRMGEAPVHPTILPIIALNKLKMTRRKKLGAGLIFATGFLSVRFILLCKK